MAKQRYTKPEDYIYASTRVRLFERRLLKAEDWVRFRQVTSFGEGLQLLKESPYGNRMEVDGLTYDESLNMESIRLRQELRSAAPGSPLLRLISLEDLYHNLKVLAKMHVLGQDLSYLLVEVEDFDLRYLDNLFAPPEQNRQESPEERAIAEVVEDYHKHQDPERIEIILDKALYADRAQLSKALGSDLIQAWQAEQTDYQNLAIFLRMKRAAKAQPLFAFAFLPGGRLKAEDMVALYGQADLPTTAELKGAGVDDDLLAAWDQALEGDIASLEKCRDEASLNRAKKAQRMTYGPEILFAYYLLRQTEIQNLRSLMIGLQSDLNAAQRAARLRLAD